MASWEDVAREHRIPEGDPAKLSQWPAHEVRRLTAICDEWSYSGGDFIEQANWLSLKEIRDEINEKFPGAIWKSQGHWIMLAFSDTSDDAEVISLCRPMIEALMSLQDYPCLDDSLASRLEHDAQIMSIQEAACGMSSRELDDEVLPEDWLYQIWSEMWDLQNSLQRELLFHDGNVDTDMVEEIVVRRGWYEMDGNEWIEFLAGSTGVKDETKPER